MSLVVLTLSGPIARSDLRGLRDRIDALLDDNETSDLLCDVARAEASAVTVDALAYLHVAARRCGCRVRIRGASGELEELVALMGLADVLATI
jgi:ABC-type transporter Mla MlaB component